MYQYLRNLFITHIEFVSTVTLILKTEVIGKNLKQGHNISEDYMTTEIFIDYIVMTS